MTAAAVQTHLVEVEFKGNRRAFFTWSGDAPPPLRAAVIVQVERGEDLGRIHATGLERAEKRKAGTPGLTPAAISILLIHLKRQHGTPAPTRGTGAG